MTGKSRWLAMLCIASLFIAVGGCSDDDDVIPNQQVSADQAAALIEDAVPFVLEFGSDIADLLEEVLDKKSGNQTRQTCVPMPGIETEFLCTVPSAGEVCPVDETTVEWVFSNCTETGPDPSILDGTVTVTGSTFSFDLLFDLDVDDGSINGSMQVTLGECPTISYQGLEIEEDGVSNTLNGASTICPDSASGTVSVTTNAPGIQRFLMEINFNTGAILVISPTTQEPLYSCFYNPDTLSAQCFPFGEF